MIQGCRLWTLTLFPVFTSWEMLRLRPHCKSPWMPWMRILKSYLRSTGWIQFFFQRYVTWGLGNKWEEELFLGALHSSMGQDNDWYSRGNLIVEFGFSLMSLIFPSPHHKCTGQDIKHIEKSYGLGKVTRMNYSVEGDDWGRISKFAFFSVLFSWPQFPFPAEYVLPGLNFIWYIQFWPYQ